MAERYTSRSSRGILALDVARQLGWAMTHPTRNEPVLGTIALKPPHGKDYGVLYNDLFETVNELISGFGPERVWFEAPLFIPHRSMHTARQLMTLAGIVELVAYQRSRPCFEGNVTEVRRAVVGPRRKTDERSVKRISLDYCNMRKWDAPDDNAADAAVLWVYGYACWLGRAEGS